MKDETGAPGPNPGRFATRLFGVAALAVLVWAKQGVQVCMNQYNGSDAKKE